MEVKEHSRGTGRARKMGGEYRDKDGVKESTTKKHACHDSEKHPGEFPRGDSLCVRTMAKESHNQSCQMNKQL